MLIIPFIYRDPDNPHGSVQHGAFRSGLVADTFEADMLDPESSHGEYGLYRIRKDGNTAETERWLRCRSGDEAAVVYEEVSGEDARAWLERHGYGRWARKNAHLFLPGGKPEAADYKPGDPPLPVGALVKYQDSPGTLFKIIEHLDPQAHPLRSPQETKGAYADGVAYTLWPSDSDVRFGNRHEAHYWVRRSSLSLVELPAPDTTKE